MSEKLSQIQYNINFHYNLNRHLDLFNGYVHLILNIHLQVGISNLILIRNYWIREATMLEICNKILVRSSAKFIHDSDFIFDVVLADAPSERTY